MIVCDDMAFIGHDYAGPKRILHQGFVVWVPKPSLIRKEELEWIDPGFPLDTDFFRRFYCDNGRDHAANERAPLPV